MFLTNILLKKVKTKNVLVMLESVCSGHRVNVVKERTADKLEIIRFDPKIQMESIYKEVKKIKSVKIIMKDQKVRQTNEIDI